MELFDLSAGSTCSGPAAFRGVLDWDGANGPDVLCAGSEGVMVFLNDGHGTLVADQPIGLSTDLPGLVGDFDGDPRDDVVFEVAGEHSGPTLAVVFADRSLFIEEPPGSSLDLLPRLRDGVRDGARRWPSVRSSCNHLGRAASFST
jgi:hypothetical protein